MLKGKQNDWFHICLFVYSGTIGSCYTCVVCMTAWYSGQQVVCVKKDKWSSEGCSGFEKVIYPRYRQVYVIHSIHLNDKGQIMLIFEETKANKTPEGQSLRFYSVLFKPILDSRGMKSLTKYLNNPKLLAASGDTIEASAHRKRHALISKSRKETPRSV